ncbi:MULTISPECIES: prepilin-type N-terminal cleavage/methylation domain-containing protein [unclassified Variovorax]|uniref:prepilin-type N-terminal cleavage/methylation domain-containing protein n=1 Tax=unclassified Variovorax TaxID=663243 RepID=UPI003F485C21
MKAWVPPRQRRCPSGFTLIEVMIAIVIMAVLSLIAWRGLDVMGRANAQLQARTEDTARLMRALQQIERDLTWRTTTELRSTADDLPARDETPATPSTPQAARNRQPAASALLLPTGMDARRTSDKPLLVELVRAAPAAPGRWQRVQWWLQSGTLYRAAGPAVADYPLPAPEPADRVAVLDGIASFEVRAWQPEGGWRRLPATGPVRAPASGLEITLGVRRNADAVMTYRQVIALN